MDESSIGFSRGVASARANPKCTVRFPLPTTIPYPLTLPLFRQLSATHVRPPRSLKITLLYKMKRLGIRGLRTTCWVCAFQLLHFSQTIGPRLRVSWMRVNYRAANVQLKKNKNGNEDYNRTCHDHRVRHCTDGWRILRNQPIKYHVTPMWIAATALRFRKNGAMNVL